MVSSKYKADSQRGLLNQYEHSPRLLVSVLDRHILENKIRYSPWSIQIKGIQVATSRGLLERNREMNISGMKTKQLRVLLKSFSNVSLGLKDLILRQMIEEELQRRES
jgi:hypothetical protein